MDVEVGEVPAALPERAKVKANRKTSSQEVKAVHRDLRVAIGQDVDVADMEEVDITGRLPLNIFLFVINQTLI